MIPQQQITAASFSGGAWPTELCRILDHQRLSDPAYDPCLLFIGTKQSPPRSHDGHGEYSDQDAGNRWELCCITERKAESRLMVGKQSHIAKALLLRGSSINAV